MSVRSSLLFASKYEPFAVMNEAESERRVPVPRAMPPGLKMTDDGSSLLAVVAPPRPLTLASCSLR